MRWGKIMEKVPVGGSIAHAYEFLFGRFFQILGTAWLPALLYGLISYAYLLNMQQWPAHGADVAMIVGTVCWLVAAGLVALAVRSVLGISLTQEAFGVRKDLTLAHFVIGPRELRLFFAQLRLILLALALYIVVIAISVAVVMAARTYGAGLAPKLSLLGMPIAVLAAVLLVVVLIAWYLLSMLRLAFILQAVASVEHKVRLLRAWQITRGSGWRIFFVYAITLLPFIIAAGVAGYYLIGPGDVANLMAAIAKAKPGNPPPVAAFYNSHAAALASIGGVLTIINGALLAGASAHAYRAVTGHEDPEPEDDAALVAPLLAPVEHHEPSVEPLPPVPDHGDNGHGDHGPIDHAPSDGAHNDHHEDRAGQHDDQAGHGDGREDEVHDETHGHESGHDHGSHGHDSGGHHAQAAPIELHEEVSDATDGDAGDGEQGGDESRPAEQGGDAHPAHSEGPPA